MTFFGCGPFENYADRKAAAEVGVYEIGVNEQYTYEKPMERGNHGGGALGKIKQQRTCLRCWWNRMQN